MAVPPLMCHPGSRGVPVAVQGENCPSRHFEFDSVIRGQVTLVIRTDIEQI